MRNDYLFTSESVSEGHPDKVCDRISDEIVDLVYREARKTGMDPWKVRVACETMATTNRVIIAGEVRVPETLLKRDKEGNILKDKAGHPLVNPAKFKSVARKAIKAIGYEQSGFHWKNARIDVLLHGQSPDIGQGVDSASDRQGEEGAGDQGIMFGYACRETPDLMPAPIYYSHKILEHLAAARHQGNGDVGRLGPDAKSQVTVRYVDGKAAEVTQIVLSTQHFDESWDSKKVRQVVEPHIRAALGELKIADNCNWYINPTGKFVIGGPDGDAGLTGRKIIVDTYGGAAPHGGGAFSGKDTPKVDRSAAYAARYLAKNVVAAGLADRCTIQLAYAIGIAQPLSVYVDLHGSGKIDEARLETALREVMDLSPTGIRRHLDLNKPIYAKTTAYGHFGRKPGRDGSFSWEKPTWPVRLKGCWRPELSHEMRESDRLPEAGAFFGRRRGRPLRPQQEEAYGAGQIAYGLDLSRPAPVSLAELFRAPVVEVRLEIGFGGGEHLLHRARENPSTGYIGVEPFVNGMAKVMASLAAEPLPNVRLYGEDALHVLDWLPPASLAGIDLFYPDPWPKKKHWKRRFVNAANLARFHRAIVAQGVFRFASDIEHYVNWTLLECGAHGGFRWLAETADDWKRPYEGWPGTRYEAKALREGRTPSYLRFVRNP